MAAHERPAVNDSGWTDWIQPVRKGYRLACCDCGLVHSLDFRTHRGRVQFRASRHARATAAVRREKAKRQKAAK